MSLRLTGVDFTPWRGMMVSVEGMLVPRAGGGGAGAAGMQEFHAVSAHSAYGLCTP